MKAKDVTLADVIAESRILAMDAVALGLLRKELIETVGTTAARGLLTRLGYAHGQRAADAARGLRFDDERELRLVGARLPVLAGFVEEATRAGEPQHPQAILRGSYEAEQHLVHHGRSQEPVCWSLCGFASGTFSRLRGVETYFLEEACVACGDAACRIVGRTAAEWGAARAAELAYFERADLDDALTRVAKKLRDAERALRRRAWSMPAELDVRSDAMRKVLHTALRAAAVDVTVIVTGESGVGKERIARLLHDRSMRAGGPFIAINCGALPEQLLESELFGHKKGAFTGAIADRAGLFEAAHNGTLFLDEIGEVPPAMQVRLLRVLQERSVRRVGENEPRRVDVRVVAATHRDLRADVDARRFREDLFYRLKVVELVVPPLRERRDDILPLARQFLDESARRMKRRAIALSPAAADALVAYAWPGNVRELENAIESAVALAEGTRIDVHDLPIELRGQRSALPSSRARGVRALADVERDAILAALEHHDGNQRKTAAALGIGTATLYRKLREYRLRDARKKARHR